MNLLVPLDGPSDRGSRRPAQLLEQPSDVILVVVDTELLLDQARKRLPLGLWQRLLEGTATRLRHTTEQASRWRGHRVRIVNGPSFSMPDVPTLRRHFGQPDAQRPGCDFPVAKLLAIFDLSTGMLLLAATAPLRTHETSQLATVHAALAPGDVLLGDRDFCSYAHLAHLVQRGLHGVLRLHHRQLVDFRSGRGHLPPGRSANPDDLPRSRWVRALGSEDQVVVWFKPKRRPEWMTPAQSAALRTSWSCGSCGIGSRFRGSRRGRSRWRRPR